MTSPNLTERIYQRFRRSRPGQVFTPKDFLDLGARGSISWVLHDLVRKGKIRTIARGLYDHPRPTRHLGLTPSPRLDRAAQAYARKRQWQIIPHPALAANLLGLSQQVPARVVYLSSGPTQSVRIGNRDIVFRHAGPKNFVAKTSVGALVIQALRYFGRNQVNDALRERLAKALADKDLKKVRQDVMYAVTWIQVELERIFREREWTE